MEKTTDLAIVYQLPLNRDLDDQIKSVLSRLDWAEVGSGAGFGDRDLQFQKFEALDRAAIRALITTLKAVGATYETELKIELREVTLLKSEAEALALLAENQIEGLSYDEGEPVGLKCPDCGSNATNYEPVFKVWKCEDCSVVWSPDELA